MHAAWVSFATIGDPGRPEYREPSRTVHHFGASPAVIHDPRRDLRTLWDGVR
ncbi:MULTISPECIES: hypothetical protein [Streptomyces]|uniref:hypothetical protein n=1 Tax=Streptomyces TaxID=1883 RepID=UPI00292E4B63|nr:hypothetical protein [Streptomyces sp. NEAU-HV9]